MKTFPLPALVAASAATSPFHLAAAGTLLLATLLGAIVHADYALRHRRVSLPRRKPVRDRLSCPTFRCERLAA